jgi:hypothetical protein
MDIFSHALYGGVAFGRKNRKNFWWAFLIGMLPDLLAFGPFWIMTTLGLAERPNWHGGHPADSIPQYIYSIYNVTHSLLIFVAVFFLIFLIRKKPFWLLGAWGLHILVDIPSHSFDFFPTPFLWPVSNFKVNGIHWGDPIIFVPNLIILAALYGWLYLFKKNNKK